MCIPGLLFLQNVHTSPSLIQNVKLNTIYDHKLYTFQLFGVHHQCLQSFNLIKILKVAKTAIWYFVSIFVSGEQ